VTSREPFAPLVGAHQQAVRAFLRRLCGDPDEVTEQVRRYESVGCDQICFGMPLNMSWADAEETIRLVGDHVIPQIDKDPVHRSTRFRDAAA